MKEYIKMLADYDQLDAGVRANWKNMTLNEQKEILQVVQELRQTDLLGVRIALLLVWAASTMIKRDHDDREQ